jgi:nucleotide-binding universal stress UspA family protein
MRLAVTAGYLADGLYQLLPQGKFGGHRARCHFRNDEDRQADTVKTSGPFRRVLAGYDGSPEAAEAVRAAAAIAARDGGHVVALSVVRQSPHADGDQEPRGEDASLRDQAEALFDELRLDAFAAALVRMSAQVVYADERKLGQVVTDYATDHGFDVLVLGRQGSGRRRGTRLGQVADYAVLACPVPVLLTAR